MKDRNRNMRAGLRDTILMINEFRKPQIFFILAILGIGTYYFNTARSLREPLTSLPEANFLTLGLAFFQSNGEYPHHGFSQLGFFILSFICIGTLAHGLADFGIALINPHKRNNESAMAGASPFSKHTVLVRLGHLGYWVETNCMPWGS